MNSDNQSSTPKKFTLFDLIPGGFNYSRFNPTDLTTFWWGNELVQKKDDLFLRYNNGDWTPLVSVYNILGALVDLTDAPQISDPAAYTNFVFPVPNETIIHCHSETSIILYNWTEKKLVNFVQFPVKHTIVDFHSQKQFCAYLFEDNLYVSSYDNKIHYQITNDGSKDIVYGQAVHRQEFGIEKGTFWSPDGEHLCFYRMDQSMVADYPLVNISSPIAKLDSIKYPMAGQISHKCAIGIFDINTQQTIYLDTGDNTDQYYAGITWHPDNKHIYLYNLNRQQNHLRLLEFDISTGQQLRQIYEETSPKYINIRRGFTFLPWDSDSFIFSSEMDGYDHLYLYNLKTETYKKITDDKFGVVLSIVGFNHQTKSLIINCTGQLEIQHNIYRISLEDESYQLLGNEKGCHEASISQDGSFIVDSWSAFSVPKRVDLVNTTTNEITTLHVSPYPYKGYQLPEMEVGGLTANDEKETQLYYRLIKPINFDENQQYPCIVYVYGGPHVRLITNEWFYNAVGWQIYMAQLGYVVFALDGRGSDQRGYEFESVIYKHLGKYEKEDQMTGVEFLKSLSYVDPDRIGVMGWSYGGFMATNLMLSYPDVFKVGVAGGPVINWAYYEIMYGERYMSTPQDNPLGYLENNMCFRASNLKGRLMIIFGYNDDVCVPQHSLSFIQACENAMTFPDLMVYPNEKHGIKGPKAVHLYRTITRYFEDHLKPLKK